ncbi:MAG: ribosome maturation factor RimP [candidate division Zixibacteria bacterium]|jgi:ribosome maturation factor RimP|nr:ribosome maturation factor RimP [candidate division Zixibacteria bacterium]
MDILENVRLKFDELAQSLGLELVETTIVHLGGRAILRLTVHKPGGVTVGECADLSRDVSDYLDTSEIIHGHYTLEVTSLGLDKPLIKAIDFKRRIGEKVRIEFKPGIYEKNVIEGVLSQADDAAITITVDDLSEQYRYENIIRGKIVY